MRRVRIRALIGILFIVGGVLLLVENLGGLSIAGLVWPFLFGAGGLMFLYVFMANRDHWWAVVPGFTLLGLTAMIAWSQLGPESAEAWGASFFLGGIALGFWVIYLSNRRRWWAIIPGGVMLTIGLFVGLSSALKGFVGAGGFLFLGLGLTFGLLFLLPTSKGRMKWALIPAAVLFVIGLLITLAFSPLVNFVWPAALILGGLYLLFRIIAPRPGR